MSTDKYLIGELYPRPEVDGNGTPSLSLVVGVVHPVGDEVVLPPLHRLQVPCVEYEKRHHVEGLLSQTDLNKKIVKGRRPTDQIQGDAHVYDALFGHVDHVPVHIQHPSAGSNEYYLNICYFHKKREEEHLLAGGLKASVVVIDTEGIHAHVQYVEEVPIGGRR